MTSQVNPTANGVLTPNQSGAQPARPSVKTRLSDVENLTRGILFVTVVALIGVLVAVGGVVSDQWRFNQDLYKEKTAAASKQFDELNGRITNMRNEIKTLEAQLNEAKLQNPKQ